MSITRWFGGAESSSDEEDDPQYRPSSPSGPSGDDVPQFNGDAEAVLVEDGRLSDDGEVPYPGGERVSQERIDAGAAAGDGLMPDGGAKYSPPGQDGD